MNEKKKLLITLGIIIGIIVLIVAISFVSLYQSSKKLEIIEETISSDKTQIIYLSRPTCYYCNLIEPITDFLQEEFELDYYHINTDEFSKSQMKKILKIMGVNESTFGTPYIAIVKNGKVIGEQIGYTDEDVLFKLFQKNGLIEENASLHLNYLENREQIWNESESKLVLVGKSGDTASIESRITFRNLVTEYSIEANYFDTAKLENETQYNELLNNLGISVEELPILTIVEDGKVIEKTKNLTKQGLEEFLKNNNYIN